MKTLKQAFLFQLVFAFFLWAHTAGAQMNTIGVTLYSECNYTGASAAIPAIGGYGTNFLLALGLPGDNTISSLRVTPGYQVVLFDNDNFTGDSLTVTANTDCLVAQGWDNRASSLRVRAAVTLYRDCNYAGPVIPLPVGSYTASYLSGRGISDNDLSSFKVLRGYEVVLFDGDTFTGDSIIIRATTDCLGALGWDNRASSLKIRAVTTSLPTSVATVYRDCNFRGAAVALPVGDYTLAQLRARGVRNNDLSSLRVNTGFEVQLFDNDNFQGAFITVVGNEDCLVGRSFNDRTTSLRVRPAGVATFYQDCNYGGYARALPAIGGYSTNFLLAYGIRDNDLSSLRINSGFEVILFDGEFFSGDSLVLTATANADCLVVRGWNDRVSSLKVRRAVAAPAPSGSLMVFPNPATGAVSLAGLKSFPATVGVYDGQGTLRKTLRLTEPSQPVTLDCTELESGLYLIRVEDAQGVRTQRLDKR